MTATGPPVLVFGGTFDPPHRAHTELPALVARAIGAARLVYVPTSINPLKTERPTPAIHRLAMLRLALADEPMAEIDTSEIERDGPSYTVDTLEVLRGRIDAAAPLRLLLGADAAVQFHRWRDPRRVLELVTPVVMLRPPWDREAFRAAMAEHGDAATVDRWVQWTVPVPAVDVSATAIRAALAEGRPLRDMVHPDVEAYIREHGLYG